MIARMLDQVGMSLDEVVAELPPCFKVEVEVFCPTERKGAVMRFVTEKTIGMNLDLTEGVRVIEDGGWVLILPDSNEPTVRIWAEGADDDSAQGRAEQWTTLVEEAIAQE